MSKYTTEVRFICESKSGLDNSVGCDDVDKVLSNSWDKIFTTKAEIFDENYRAVICKKILKHYYLREIGAETFGVWKLWLNTRLEEILPYYNQLYKSALLEFNPLYDVDLTRTHNRTIDENKTENGTSTETSTGTSNDTFSNNGSATSSSSGSSKDLFSDTPQGALTGVENETYLTNARKINNTDSSTSESSNTSSNNNEKTETKNGSNSNTGTVNNTEEYLERVSGKQGGSSYSSMLKEFRDTFLNIDMKIITEFNDLFFGLW